MSTPLLRVAPCSAQAARFACDQWHYSHAFPAGRRSNYGVWEGDRFVGAVVFSRGACRWLGRAYGLAGHEVCELTRVALRSHEAPVTQIVSRALALLKESSPGLRLVVSFADPNAGHHGGIYQAGNWTYTGQSDAVTMFRDKYGRVWHPRQVSHNGRVVMFNRLAYNAKRSECTPLKVPGKHRYLMPLDRSMRRLVAKLAQQPPGRGGLDGEPPALRVGGAGSTPAPGSMPEAAHG